MQNSRFYRGVTKMAASNDNFIKVAVITFIITTGLSSTGSQRQFTEDDIRMYRYIYNLALILF